MAIKIVSSDGDAYTIKHYGMMFEICHDSYGGSKNKIWFSDRKMLELTIHVLEQMLEEAD